jgi:hypothetical protein
MQIVQQCNAITFSCIITLCDAITETKTCTSRLNCQCRDTDSERVKDVILSRFCERRTLEFGFCCSDTSNTQSSSPCNFAARANESFILCVRCSLISSELADACCGKLQSA